uniref:Uncharacterized protein n=1 Tax=Arundo donax TaxID=35708 RepID=A0A0A9AEF5_ARUDO
MKRNTMCCTRDLFKQLWSCPLLMITYVRFPGPLLR